MSQIAAAESLTAEKEIEGSQQVMLDMIVVTNRRDEVALTDTAENVEVISEEEIQKLPARNLSEVLAFITGVNIQPRQGFGRATSISIQGSDSRQVRVMIDGIPLNSQASGQVNPAIFPIENISRIEVIKGPSSSVWGSSLGGVINVITKDTGNTLIPKGNLTASFAEFKTQRESFELSGKVGDAGYYISSSYMDSGGEGPKDDVLEKRAFGKFSFDLNALGKILASFGFNNADVNSGEFPDGTWEAQPYRSRYGKVGWEGSLAGMEARIDFKHSRQEVITESFDSIFDDTPSSRVQAQDMLYQLSINTAAHPRNEDLLVLGADFDCDTLKSTYLLKAKNVRLQAPYANYTLKLNPWDFNFGLRYDHSSEFKGQLSPSLGFVFRPKDSCHTVIRANFSRAFNAPPLLWKYYEAVPGITTNPDIRPERAWVYEAGFESRPIDKFWIKFSLYRSDVSSAIALAENESGLLFMKNFEKFRRQGAELQFKIFFCEALNFFASGAFNDVENRVTGQTVRDGVGPRQRYDLGIEYKNKSGFSFSLKSYYNRWDQSSDYYEPNDRKMITDVRFSQRFKYLEFFLNIYNLTNSKYWTDFFFPIPRRYFEGGMSLGW